MKPSEIKVRKTYVGNHGSKRIVVCMKRGNGLEVEYYAPYRALPDRKTVLLSTFARWARQEVEAG